MYFFNNNKSVLFAVFMPRKEKIANTYVSAILNSNGAGNENRTRTSSLEGCCSAIKPYLQKMVGKTGFEPATSWSQTKRSTKLSYFPMTRQYYKTFL